jgi:hypothetical protein
VRPIEIDVEVHRLIEQHRRSFEEGENDILRRILPLVPFVPFTPPVPPAPIRPLAPLVPIAPPVPLAPLVPIAPLVPLAPNGPAPSEGGAWPASSSAESAPGRGDASSGGGSPPPPGTRRRGQFTVEVRGERISAANLKLAYRTLLETLDSRYPDFLAAFAEEGGRSRRFVARTQAQLYAASPHLAKRHAALLESGWHFDSNVSAIQVARRARIAARICGLRYGADVRILENLREI